MYEQWGLRLQVMTIHMPGPESIERVESAVKREVASASSLCHPHVVKLLDVLRDHGCLVLVWELITGAPLCFPTRPSLA